ncbi:pts system, fructose-specific IIA/FPR component [Salmonella enterica subsp. enterica]|uniref:Pts system, fructose-specific IIA/FPR component n=1 Tax=Salmonella enterica I TaxID=59201 RepID=A0A379WQK0_SALET|nr:pts system, fructose-specific IIA/FPR component [Salmonella enterica subsp. enterica]
MAGGYVDGMLAREQQPRPFLQWYCDSHGTTDTRDQVLKTASRSSISAGRYLGRRPGRLRGDWYCRQFDEHLGLLRQLTHVLSDDSVLNS